MPEWVGSWKGASVVSDVRGAGRPWKFQLKKCVETPHFGRGRLARKVNQLKALLFLATVAAPLMALGYIVPAGRRKSALDLLGRRG